MTHMKNICQKLTVAAASGAIGFAALETLPAKAASSHWEIPLPHYSLNFLVM